MSRDAYEHKNCHTILVIDNRLSFNLLSKIISLGYKRLNYGDRYASFFIFYP